MTDRSVAQHITTDERCSVTHSAESVQSLDVDAIEREWRSNFPEGDPRQTILALVAEVRRLRESEDELLQSERDLMHELLEARDA